MSLRSDSRGNTPPTAADTPPGTYPITTDHMVSTDDQLMRHTTGDASLSYISMYDDHTIIRVHIVYLCIVYGQHKETGLQESVPSDSSAEWLRGFTEERSIYITHSVCICSLLAHCKKLCTPCIPCYSMVCTL